jgi:uncharacterized coiled-coil protein SlyX
MKKLTAFFCVLFFIAIFSSAFAADIESRIKAMEDTLKAQQKTIEEQHKIINELKNELSKVSKKEELPQAEAKKAEEKKTEPKIAGLFGGSNLTNPNISVIVDTFLYTSDRQESTIENSGIPGYTRHGFDRKKGFNLEAAELFLFAPVDPYFNLYVTAPIKESGAELEEAYFLTTSLSEGFQLKGGKFRIGFGRLNAQHTHTWNFADAPLVYKAFVGDEGIVEKGAQLTYLPSLPFYTILGVEALQGENNILFGTNAQHGPHAFTGFLKASFDITDNSTLLIGQSVISGKTSNDSIAANTVLKGTSTLYGTELTYKWKPSKDKSFTLQSEYLLRNQKGDYEDTAVGTTDPIKRYQDGIYAQGIYQLGRWSLGLRHDMLDIFKKEYTLAGAQQRYSHKPTRTSGSIDFNATEFSRIRLQYSHDKSARHDKINHELFLQFTLGIGAHAAHPF